MTGDANASARTSTWPAVASVVVAVVALLLSSIALCRQFQLEKKQEARIQKAETPHLTYLKGSFQIDHGKTVITVKNQSAVVCAITDLIFRVTASELLQRIRAQEEKKDKFSQLGDRHPVSSNPRDGVDFTTGIWSKDEKEFVFIRRVNLYVPGNSVNSFVLRIRPQGSPFATDETYDGELTIKYDGDKRLVLEDIHIKTMSDR